MRSRVHVFAVVVTAVFAGSLAPMAVSSPAAAQDSNGETTVCGTEPSTLPGFQVTTTDSELLVSWSPVDGELSGYWVQLTPLTGPGCSSEEMLIGTFHHEYPSDITWVKFLNLPPSTTILVFVEPSFRPGAGVRPGPRGQTVITTGPGNSADLNRNPDQPVRAVTKFDAEGRVIESALVERNTVSCSEECSYLEWKLIGFPNFVGDAYANISCYPSNRSDVLQYPLEGSYYDIFVNLMRDSTIIVRCLFSDPSGKYVTLIAEGVQSDTVWDPGRYATAGDQPSLSAPTTRTGQTNPDTPGEDPSRPSPSEPTYDAAGEDPGASPSPPSEDSGSPCPPPIIVEGPTLASQPSRAVKPSPPGNIRMGQCSYNEDETSVELEILWDPPAEDGGARVVRYHGRVRKLSVQALPDYVLAQVVRNFPAIISSDYTFREKLQIIFPPGEPFSSDSPAARVWLATCEFYRLAITAANEARAASDAAALYIATPCPGTLPGKPVSIKLDVVEGGGSPRLAANWQEPQDDGGARVKSYRVELKRTDLSGNAPWVDYGITYQPEQRLVKNPELGARYAVRVAARNYHGQGEWAEREWTVEHCPFGGKYETDRRGFGRPATRIYALKSFKTIDGTRVRVGDEGGIVSNDGDNVSQSDCAWIHKNDKTQVVGDARISGDAYIKGGARARQNARIYDNAIVDGGYIQILGQARIYGNARVTRGSYIYGGARVYGHAKVGNNGGDELRIYGDAEVYGKAVVAGHAQVYGDAKVYGNAFVGGNARVSGSSQVRGDAIVFGDMNISSGIYDGEREHEATAKSLYRELYNNLYSEFRADCLDNVRADAVHKLTVWVMQSMRGNLRTGTVEEAYYVGCRLNGAYNKAREALRKSAWEIFLDFGLPLVKSIKALSRIADVIEIGHLIDNASDVKKVSDYVDKWGIDEERIGAVGDKVLSEFDELLNKGERPE